MYNITKEHLKHNGDTEIIDYSLSNGVDKMFMSVRLKKAPIIITAAAAAAIAAAVIIFSHTGRAQSADDGLLRVPIIMYHSITADESRFGEYAVSPQQLECDIICLKQHGYEPVFVNELIMHVRYGYELPKKPVIITLDDGHLNALTRALPVCRRQGFKMTVACVSKWSEAASEEAEPDENFSYCDAADIRDLRSSGLCEVVCHSFDMHSLEGRRGVLRMDGESDEDYCAALLRDLSKAQRFFDERCEFRPNVFCYPYGFYDDEAEKTVRAAGFEASLGVEERINIITDEESLYCLGRFNRPYGETSEQFFKRIGVI